MEQVLELVRFDVDGRGGVVAARIVVEDVEAGGGYFCDAGAQGGDGGRGGEFEGEVGYEGVWGWGVFGGVADGGEDVVACVCERECEC